MHSVEFTHYTYFFQSGDNSTDLYRLADVLWHGRYIHDAQFKHRNRKMPSRKNRNRPDYEVFCLKEKLKVSERH